MSVREILQTEIWSKETSRKILARIRKVLGRLKYVGIGLAVSLLCFALWFEVWTHWLSAKERSAGRLALTQIDALQNSDELDQKDFDSQLQRTQMRVHDADNAATTARDRVTVLLLELYLDQVKDARQQRKIQEKIYARLSYVRSKRSKELDMESEDLERSSIKVWRDAAHESLDK